VNSLYVNPETDDFRRVDYRLYDPEADGKSKLDHVHDMLTNVVHHQRLPFRAVLMDSEVCHQRLDAVDRAPAENL
jgi:hypothetical protein